jgi:tripartite motif-containing protein 71
LFSSEAKVLSTFGTKGSGKGQLNMPQGLAVDKAGNIVVADNWKSQDSGI